MYMYEKRSNDLRKDGGTKTSRFGHGRACIHGTVEDDRRRCWVEGMCYRSLLIIDVQDTTTDL